MLADEQRPHRATGLNPVSIQDANLLKIPVQYCVKAIVPMVEHLLSSASTFDQRQSGGSFSENANQTRDPYVTICAARKGFVLTAEATVRMQSVVIHDTGNFGIGKKYALPLTGSPLNQRYGPIVTGEAGYKSAKSGPSA